MTRTKPFTLIAAILFAVAALAHLYRLVRHSTLVIGRHVVPEWASMIAMVVLVILAIGLYRESRN
jgi:protein-S-isoprenylcysteine O-methyltransferase Ste14